MVCALFCWQYAKTAQKRKTTILTTEKMKIKIPISEKFIPKPIDKFLDMVYNDANETRAASERGMTAVRRKELWQPNPRSPLPLWYPTTLTARRSARRWRPPWSRSRRTLASFISSDVSRDSQSCQIVYLNGTEYIKRGCHHDILLPLIIVHFEYLVLLYTTINLFLYFI